MTGEKRVVISRKRDLNVTIPPADKGGTTIVLNTEEYRDKTTH